MDSYWGSPEWRWFTAASILTLLVGVIAALLIR